MPRGTDAVVVGGGVVGCAVAWELARRGVRVTLLERDELAAGASGRNHGLLLTPLDPALVPMARASRERYEEVAASTPVPVGLDREPVGFLVVAGEDEPGDALGRAEAEAAARCGVPVEPLEGRELRALEPALAHDLARGWLLRDGWRLQPALLTVALALAARELGGEVRTRSLVRALLRRGRAWGVLTDDGLLEADVVVVAAGPWSPPLVRPLGHDVPVTGARGWLVSLAPRPQPLARVVERAGWHEPPEAVGMGPLRAREAAAGADTALVGTLLQPNPDGTLLVGGSREPALGPDPEDPSVPARLLQGAVRTVPALAEASVLSAWWGVRPMSPDGRPIVGWLEEGLLAATGHGSIGVILGGGTGRLAAAMVAGEEPPFDPAPYDPGRFGRA
ncbi:MAG TPA: FAD-binding oxidoreductase [Actinomycetota bacterium]|nr:FAD-binding oxidoreductase [Actinomycetota bacterium]